MPGTSDLALAIKDHVGLQSSVMAGIVTAVNADGTVTVNVRGSAQDYPALDSYHNPNVGDQVQISSYGSSAFVIGKINNGSGLLRIQSNIELVSFTPAALSNISTYTFAEPYMSSPAMCVNIQTGFGTAAHWDARAVSVGTTGFSLFVFANDPGIAQVWSGISVSWIAIGV